MLSKKLTASNNLDARSSNIELLRILAIYGVIILHYNGNFAFPLVEVNSTNFYLLQVFEALFICAVNLFVLISGYFLSASNNRKIIKPLELLIQVIVMSVATYLLSAVLAGGFSFKAILLSAIPNNYFVILYITLYLISPYINLAVNKLSNKQMTIMTGLMLALFSVWPTILDVFGGIFKIFYGGLYTTNTAGSQQGYSLINFALMYIIGAFLRKTSIKPKRVFLYIGLLISVLLIFIWQMYQPQVARGYSNPAVIASAVFVFLIFKNFKIESRFINNLSKGCFTCFLIHGIFLGKIRIESVVNASTIILVLHIIVSSAIIFVVSFIVFKVYDTITKPIFKIIEKPLSSVNIIVSPEENK